MLLLYLSTQKKVQQLLKDGWLSLPEAEKETFRAWTEWDKKRHARDLTVFQSRRDGHEDAAGAASAEDDDMKAIHVPKKRKKQAGAGAVTIPKKRKA